MTTEHSSIVNAQLHEPKDISASAIDKVYAANGSGGGTWRKITAASIDTASIKNVNLLSLEFIIDKINTAKSHFLVVPFAGDITKIYSVLDQAIAGGDVLLTPKIDGTVITNGDITITQSGSAGGDVDSSTPSAANTLTAGQALEVVCDGGTSTADAHAHLTVIMDIS